MTVMACCSTIAPYSGSEDNARWFSSNLAASRGVVVIVHGLNQRPSALDELSTALADTGFHVYRTALTGHGDGPPVPVDATRWITDVAESIKEVRARFPKLPLHVLGYSIGALAIIRSLDAGDIMPPNSLVLLAPAISLRPLSHLSRLFALLGSTRIHVPSLSPRLYRRHTRIPAKWYDNLFEMFDAISVLDNPHYLRIVATLILVSPSDELVSYLGIERWISLNGLDGSWDLERANPSSAPYRSFEHLIVDEASTGRNEWKRLLEKIVCFFESHGSATNP